MIKKPNILIICTRNKKRSRTAEYIFKNDSRFNIRSAGLSPKSERKITEKDVNWADFIFVMESKLDAHSGQSHRGFLKHTEPNDFCV